MSTHRTRPVSPRLLGKAALRIGARRPDSDLGLALAAVGLILASMPRAPRQVGLPSREEVAAMLPLGSRAGLDALLETAEGIVGWLATTADVELAHMPAAGSC